MTDFTYRPDRNFGGGGLGETEYRQNYADDVWRARQQAQLNAWLGGRQQYAQSLGQQYAAAQRPGAEIAYRDARRTNALSMARRGLRGGSADAAGAANARQGYAQQLAQIMGGAQQVEQQQRGRDLAQSFQLQSAGYDNPGRALTHQSAMQGLETQAGLYAQLGEMERIRQQAKNQWNQNTAQRMAAWAGG